MFQCPQQGKEYMRRMVFRGGMTFREARHLGQGHRWAGGGGVREGGTSLAAVSSGLCTLSLSSHQKVF